MKGDARAQGKLSSVAREAGGISEVELLSVVSDADRARISACILARNEEGRITDALRSLEGWTSQIIVIDNESEDRTAEIAREFGAWVISAPRAATGANFDALRNLAIEHASGDWIFYLDADERVPARLGPLLKQLVAERGNDFEALLLPFRHYFCGRWMRHCNWWPGYTRPQLLKKGRFRYNDRIHGGVQVDGRSLHFPADDPDLALIHYSYDDLHHYLTKLNQYTDSEAESLLSDGVGHSWKAQVAHFVHDFQVYYEQGEGHRDGMHGFVLTFLSAFYRFAARAKLWDLRRKRNQLVDPAENEPVPSSLREVFDFMERVARDGAAPWIQKGQYNPVHPLERIPETWLQPAKHGVEFYENDSIAPGQSTIAACVVVRNEGDILADALRSVAGWTSPLLVIDNDSTDDTAATARRYTDRVINVTQVQGHMETVRFAAAEQVYQLGREREQGAASGDGAEAGARWVLFLDADERVPARLAATLLRLVEEHGAEFDALFLPFQWRFCDKWIRRGGQWPGYKAAPQLVKQGTYRLNPHVHWGIDIQGRSLYFPAEDPDLAVLHFSVRDVAHYIAKENRATTQEVALRYAGGWSHSWQAQLAHFTLEWQDAYETCRGDLDGMHGFALAFLRAMGRFWVRAKLWDCRQQRGEAPADEPVPTSFAEVLGFIRRVHGDGAERWLGLLSLLPPQESSPEQPASETLSPPPPLPLIWASPLADSSGYADEARQFVLGLAEAGEDIYIAHTPWGNDTSGLTPDIETLLAQRSVSIDTLCEIFVRHTLPPLQQPAPHAQVNVARTMFETDGLPASWAAALNRMDRIWVPAIFNRETFIAAGVSPDKIAVIPGAIDAAAFAAPVAPLPLDLDGASFRFLSVFDWSIHKGWDVLLEAFARAFPRAEEGVRLVLKVWSSRGLTPDDIRTQADTHLRASLGVGLDTLTHIRFYGERLPATEMPRVYRAADAFVLPTRGEGWCRPLMEAMASGLPTIATAWGGITDFHDERVGYPLRYQVTPVSPQGEREIPSYAGQRWAEPDGEHLRRLLRLVARRPDSSKKRGQEACKRIATKYSRAAVAHRLQAELTECRKLAEGKAPPLNDKRKQSQGVVARAAERSDATRTPFRPPANPLPFDAEPTDSGVLLSRPLRLRWEGDQAVLSSLARVNRELCLGLLAADDIELSIAGRAGAAQESLADSWDADWASGSDAQRFTPLFARRNAPSVEPPDITVRHHWPPDWRRPDAGRLVVMQPWELSHLPRQEWVEGARRHADEVWAYSRFVRDVYIRSGVPAERVKIVPLGVRTDVFRPNGPRFPLPERSASRTTRFLFVGGAVDRKGADLLLAAYQRAFLPGDDVSLIVKDMGTRTFYRGQTLREAFLRAQADPRTPDIVYLEDDLTDERLAGLYRACTCVVLPYRGEGFGLSPLEGMACGLPVIVTAGGATDDYVDDAVALRVPYHRRVRVGHYRQPSPYPADFLVDPWELEPDLDALIDALRWVHERPVESAERGQSAQERVLTNGWSWSRSVTVAHERLRELAAPRLAVRAAAPEARLWSRPDAPKTLPPGKSSRRRGGSGAKSSANEAPLELSLCIIARDEEARIGKCLESVRAHVDEMIVVDTGSRDQTREIAASYGARVFDFPWTDSFAEARNQSLAQARGRWIFWMDADDVIPPECGARLRELIQRHPSCDAAYQVQVRIPPAPSEFGESVVDHIKLFPNRPELRFEHRIHEQVLPSLRRTGIPIHFSDLYVVHQHYDRSPEGQAKKRRRDFRLLERDLTENPDHPFVLFNLGMTYLYATHEFEIAAHYLTRSLQRSHPRDSIVRKAYALLTSARLCQQEWAAALTANEEGRAHYPDDAELLYQAGQIYQEVGRFGDARACLERLVTGQDDPHYRSVDTGLRTYKGLQELARLYRRLGDPSHGADVLQRIVTEYPNYLPARADLEEALGQIVPPAAPYPEAATAAVRTGNTATFGHGNRDFFVETAHPIAIASHDHLFPHGTARDNSFDLEFNRRLFQLIPAERVRLLDLGCAGGGFVRSILDQGGLGIGVEGSDYCQRHRRAEWANIPNHLFTADVARPFTVGCGTTKPFRFNVITAWELLEHIADEDLDTLFHTMRRHAAPTALGIFSIQPTSYVSGGVEYHTTVRPQAWWLQRLAASGFVLRPDLLRHFDGHFVRGWPKEPSFQVVAEIKGEA